MDPPCAPNLAPSRPGIASNIAALFIVFVRGFCYFADVLVTCADSPVCEGDILAGKYCIENIIGLGGMGLVVAARHLQLGKRVAIKFLPSACESPDAIARFLREARAVSHIQSEHVARVLDVGSLDTTGAPYLVMEYLHGQDLSHYIRDRGPVPVDLAVSFVLQACEAIAEAHAIGIIHRDLKPANIFLTERPDGSPLIKVLDFGISKTAIDPLDANAFSLTSTGVPLGTPLYMAPEQLREAKNADARADIWGLGTILYELVCGTPVFGAASYPELVARILVDPPVPLRLRRSGLPDGFSETVAKCLQKAPDDRFASVADLASALLPYGNSSSRLSHESILALCSSSQTSLSTSIRVLPPSLAPSSPKTFFDHARSRLPSLLAVVAATALVLLSSLWSLQHPSRPKETIADFAQAPSPSVPPPNARLLDDSTTSPALSASNSVPPPGSSIVLSPLQDSPPVGEHKKPKNSQVRTVKQPVSFAESAKTVGLVDDPLAEP